MRVRVVRREDGQATVEFAFILPLILLILLGLLDFGRALNYWIDLTHLATSGARYAVVNGYPGCTSGNAVCNSPTLQQYIAGQSDSGELQNGAGANASSGPAGPLCVVVNFPSTTSGVGDPVQVVAKSTDFHFIPFLKLGTITLTGKATMRLEQAATRYGTGGKDHNGNNCS